MREKWSADARSPALAAELADILPARPRILYLQAGPATLVGWFAPMLARAHVWLLADDTEHLVSTAFERIAAWAERRGSIVTYPGKAMLMHTPGGAWRMEGLALEREATPEGLPLDRVDAVVCSALLDRVSRDWFDRLLSRLRVPFLASLVFDGAMHWKPAHPLDWLIRAGVARERSGDYGYGRPAFGARAPQAIVRALHTHGFAVRSAAADLRVPPGALEWTRGLATDAAAVAIGAFIPKAPAIRDWREARLRQALGGRLAVRIGQRDILGVPRRS